LRGILFAAALGSCRDMAFEGRVVDAADQGVPGALVALGPEKCQALTDAFGAFSIRCLPGTYSVTIAKDGYLGDALELQAPEKKVYDAGKRRLVQVPEEKGFLAFDKNTYRGMKPGRLERRTGGSTLETWRAYCLAPKLSEVNKLAPGSYPFLDHASPGWRAFRLDDEGCAYRMSPTSQGQWGVDYAVAPKYEVKKANPDTAVVTLHLEAGSYFVADWASGFFTPAADDPVHYSGYWIDVGG
jgi:Carboxypeptidase regulatory-like domain